MSNKNQNSSYLTNETVGACIHGLWLVMVWEVRVENIFTLRLVKIGRTVSWAAGELGTKREQAIEKEGRARGGRRETNGERVRERERESEGNAREPWWQDLCYHSWADWQNHSGYLVILARRMSITSGCFQCVVVCVCVSLCVCVCVSLCVCVCVCVCACELSELFNFFKPKP